MNNKPLVSIGMPVYNGEKYLELAIRSFLEQSYSNFELIISDNASFDKTKDICRHLATKDSRIRYFRNQENYGAGKNYNDVFKLSSGKYFKWAAHDDLHSPVFLERCVEILENDPSVVLVYTQTVIINEQGKPFQTYSDNLDLRSPQPHQRFKDFLARPGMCHPVFGLIRREILEKTGLIGNYPRSDRNLIGEISLWGQISELPDRLFFRRKDGFTSTEVNRTERKITQWFDPNAKGTFTFPRGRRFLEYYKAINRAPLTWSQRLQCYLLVGRFVLYPKRWKGLFDDFYQVVRKSFGNH
jgi:glycosyltransferase involved in cell wall biosynthesis